MKKEQSILQLFPILIRPYFEKAACLYDELSEIRIRSGKPVCIYCNKMELYIDEGGNITDCVTKAVTFCAGQVESIFNHICQYSPYAYGEELRQGFLTVAGGHRIGVAGQTILEKDYVKGIRNIRFLNIRISHEIKGCASFLLSKLYEKSTGLPYNCLIIAPPGCGKTTMLRDMIRLISDGNPYAEGISVGIVDERSEIAGSFLGEPQNDVGMRTDVLDACPKTQGMMMLLRSMAPKVIAVDELGTQADAATMLLIMRCGCRVISSVHGEGLKQIKEKLYLDQLLDGHYFQRIVVLSKDRRAVILDEEGTLLNQKEDEKCLK